MSTSFEQDMDKLITESIERFGKEIHRTLMRNVVEKHKGDWKDVSKEDLRDKLKEEVYELLVALKKDKPEYITLETTDVAAVCMFLYDNFGSKNL